MADWQPVPDVTEVWPPSGLDWILDTGFWRDDGYWRDNDVWRDYPRATWEASPDNVENWDGMGTGDADWTPLSTTKEEWNS